MKHAVKLLSWNTTPSHRQHHRPCRRHRYQQMVESPEDQSMLIVLRTCVHTCACTHARGSAGGRAGWGLTSVRWGPSTPLIRIN